MSLKLIVFKQSFIYTLQSFYTSFYIENSTALNTHKSDDYSYITSKFSLKKPRSVQCKEPRLNEKQIVRGFLGDSNTSIRCALMYSRILSGNTSSILEPFRYSNAYIFQALTIHVKGL